MRLISLAVLVGNLVSAAAIPAQAATPTRADCARFSIDGAGYHLLSALEADPGLQVWAELDHHLVACGDGAAIERLGRQLTADRRWPAVALDRLFLVRGSHPGGDHWDASEVALLARGGAFSVLAATSGEVAATLASGRLPKESLGHPGCGRSQVLRLEGGVILARQAKNRQPRARAATTPAASGAVDAVDGARWFSAVVTLAGWNRWTHGNQIHQARDWLVAQFGALAGVGVETQSFSVGGTTAYNVVATLPGSSRPGDLVVVGGHYDSTSEQPSNSAPGAEDNASGCAGVLELARVLSTMPPQATVIFVCYSGEEQGLHGGIKHAGSLVSSGQAQQVDLMLNMDMIGYTGDADLDCLLETENPHAALLDLFEDAAAAHTTLRTVTSLFAFGSDHVPYLDRGMPALLTIENDWDSYPAYHRSNDLPANLDQDMGYQVLLMNAAVLAEVAGADDGSAIFADGFESGDMSGWDKIIN